MNNCIIVRAGILDLVQQRYISVVGFYLKITNIFTNTSVWFEIEQFARLALMYEFIFKLKLNRYYFNICRMRSFFPLRILTYQKQRKLCVCVCCSILSTTLRQVNWNRGRTHWKLLSTTTKMNTSTTTTATAKYAYMLSD